MALNLPTAWEQCEDSVCPDATAPKANPRDKEKSSVSMKDTPKSTCQVPCGCRLFSAPKDDDDDSAKWNWEYNTAEISNVKDKKFKWICVKPVLDGDETVAAKGECKAPEFKEDPNTLKSMVRCPTSTTCTQCRLYRWEKDKRKNKWEKVTVPHQQENGYVYGCFCIS
jgi:hypothetical protein